MSALANDDIVVGRLSIGADLRFLVHLRTLAIIGQTAAVVVSSVALHYQLPILALGLGVALFAVFNLITWDRISRKLTLDDGEFFRQILVDIGVLTYLLFLSGGPANPFHDMYLLPLTISAAALPRHLVWRVAAISITCYTLVAYVYLPLPEQGPQMTRFLDVAEWVNHSIIALLVAHFVVRISAGLRERDALLAQAREKELTNGCIVTVGSVAAGAAHELGTPLATIAVAVGELRRKHGKDPDLGASLDLISGRVEACKHSLNNLRTFVRDINQATTTRITVARFAEMVIDRFRALRPEVNLRHEVSGAEPMPQMFADLTLQQAIINLINNAAEVSPHEVSLKVFWDSHFLTVLVCDVGPGISPKIAERLGKMFVTTKPPETGTGLGLFLTNVTISRLGGQLKLSNRAGGGTCAEIVVPLPSLINGSTFQ